MNSQEEELQKLMQETSDTFRANSAPDTVEKPTDKIPLLSENDVNIPDEELTEVVMSDLRNDMADKEDYGWNEKREYDFKAYYGIKDLMLQNFPYSGASAYPVPITSVLLDTMHSMLDDLVWRNSNKIVIVNPVSDEDVKKAKNLEWLMNWQCLNDIQNMQREDSASNFGMLFNGTAYEKILRVDPKEYKLQSFNVPIEFIFLPIDAKSPDIEDTDHVIQIIPLSSNDVRARIASGVYRNLDKIGKGFIPSSTSVEMFDRMRKEISGLDTTTKSTRDTWYIGEYYKTYYPKGSMRPVELIIQFSPSTGEILRKVINKDGMRPFVDKYILPNNGLAFHISVPEKIRNVQEKATYMDKQATDAMDKIISPAGFYDGTEKFDPRVSMRAPTSMQPMKNVGSIVWEPVNTAPIQVQRMEVKSLWLEAERQLGITDMQQGVVSVNEANTLGQDQMRSQRADIRFSKIAKFVNYHWKRKIRKIYQYNDKYMPRSTKVKVLGSNRYESIDKLFPREQLTEAQIAAGETQSKVGIGLTGKYDFLIANKSVEQQARENQRRSAFYGAVLADPLFGQDAGNHYRALEAQSEANEIYDLETVVKKPPEASQFTPDELLNRLLDGDNVIPSQIGNPQDYLATLEIFMETGNFKEASPEIQKKISQFAQIVDSMAKAKILAFQDFQKVEGVKNLLAQKEQFAQQQSQGKGNIPAQSSLPIPSETERSQ